MSTEHNLETDLGFIKDNNNNNNQLAERVQTHRESINGGLQPANQTRVIYIPMFKGYSGFQRFGLYDNELLGNKIDEEEFQAIVD
jgi:hypothetical protein